MKKLLTLSFFAFSVLFISCEDEEEKHPKIETVSVVATSASEVNVQGNIVETGSIKILEYGFLYSYQQYIDYESGTKIQITEEARKGQYQTVVNIKAEGNYSSYNPSIYVRSYLKNEKGTVYGEVKSVQLPVLSTQSVSPLSAKIGDIITISGKNFSTDKSKNIVKFNEAFAEVKEATSTILKVSVPGNITYSWYGDNVRISVTNGIQTVQATENFKILPNVTGFSPTSGTIGSLVTITGTNLTSVSSYNAIRIGDQTISAQSVTSTYIAFVIPSNVKTEKLTFKVIASNGTLIDVPGEFTINAPVIESISPLTGISSTIVTIKGNNFIPYSSYSSTSKITFGTSEASIISGTANEIKVYAPLGLSLGSHSVKISTSIHTITSPSQFTVSSPVITSFTPGSGFQGNFVTINGSNFGSSYYGNSVKLGSQNASIYSWSENIIQVTVPYLNPGAYQFTINAGGQSVVSSESYTVKP